MPIASPLLAPAHAAIEALPVYSGEAHTDLDVGDYDMALERVLVAQRKYGAHHREKFARAIDAVSKLRLDVRERAEEEAKAGSGAG